MTTVRCPSCGARLRLSESSRPGKRLRCPKCLGVVPWPEPVAEPAPLLEAVPEAPPQPAISGQSAPGIQGWLILFGLGLVVSLLGTAGSILLSLSLLDSRHLPSEFKTVLKVETVLLVLTLAFQVYVLVAFLSRQRVARFLVIGLLSWRVVLSLVDLVLLASLTTEDVDGADVMRSLVGAAIWVPYFVLSKRVQATFVAEGWPGGGLVRQLFSGK